MQAKDFGDYIRKLRKKRKLTIRQLDLYSGVSHSYISQIERGIRGIPKPDILKKLSGPLNVDYADLMKAAGYIEDTSFTKESNTKKYDYTAQILKEMVEHYQIDLKDERQKQRLEDLIKIVLSDLEQKK